MAQDPDFIVIAHRGASGERPEHTLAAYELAIDQGADYIEPDLVPTRDGVLVARHENEIGGTTDVADRPEFATRLTTRVIDGEEVTGWFTEDFTLAELRTLRARERLPDIRPQNARFDGLYQVPTLEEIIQLVRAKEAETGRVIGLYPEIKHPGYFQDIGIDVAHLLVTQLHAAGYEGADAPVFIQCFEVAPLWRLASITELRLVQLVEADGGPADNPSMTYAQMVTPEGLAEIAEYADGVGMDLRLVLGEDGSPTGVVETAHGAGLVVHGWTLRKENAFLPATLRSSEDDGEVGNLASLAMIVRAIGVDGVFTDDPAVVVPTNPRDGLENLLYRVITTDADGRD
ncbi:glycerophosphodiester phosphodiesterase [Aurantiacibacter gilvus]|uniref:glycerophosphodiester phosphodiesterase n=1 Tax=Aurantiacibacter gilvus TaxID=3139141 RepID=A0ABU9IIV3_9SPHN